MADVPIATETQGSVPVRRSGQTMQVSFFEAIIAAYTNLTHRPIVLFAYVLLVLILMAEHQQVEDRPLEGFLAKLQIIVAQPEIATWEKSLINMLIKLLEFLISNKQKFIELAMVWIPYLAKPSSNNMLVSITMSVVVIAFKQWNLIEILVMSQLYFLFTQLRNPKYKLAILVAFVAVFVLGYEIPKLIPDKDKPAVVDPAVTLKPVTPTKPSIQK